MPWSPVPTAGSAGYARELVSRGAAKACGLRAFLACSLHERIAEKITCPVCAGCGESGEFFPGQPEELMQQLTAPATRAGFTDAEGAGAHCQVGAQRLPCARRASARAVSNPAEEQTRTKLLKTASHDHRVRQRRRYPHADCAGRAAGRVQSDC